MAAADRRLYGQGPLRRRAKHCPHYECGVGVSDAGEIGVKLNRTKKGQQWETNQKNQNR